MALVTVQRSPTPSSGPEDRLHLGELKSEENLNCSCGEGGQRSPRCLLRNRSLSECYFAVKGAAVILPQNECIMMPRQSNSAGGEIQQHLTAMLHLLRSQDTLKMAVRLESLVGVHTRYMAIVSTVGRQDNVESTILGIDYESPEQTTMGLVLPIWASTNISLDGDGGICLSTSPPESHHLFKPVSVQAMWSAFQSLHRELDIARANTYFPGGWTHTWLSYYTSRISSPDHCQSEWHAEWHHWVPGEDEAKPTGPLTNRFQKKGPERTSAENLIRVQLKDIMQSVDLDEVTSKDIREKLEENLQFDLNPYKEFLDQEMLVILGQMDKPSQIFPCLYLGTEWNASNWDELRQNNVGLIVNVTKEVDNFFPGLFDYMKIPVSDEANSELLKHWDVSYKFMSRAKEKKCAVLVHCKKGISRSSSTVIAYAMKEYCWSLEKSLEYVKKKRNCITPNKGFMAQLRIYQGILDASRNRNNALWNQEVSAVIPRPLTPPDVLPGSRPCLTWETEDSESVIYSEKMETPISLPAVVAMPSGNILKSSHSPLPRHRHSSEGDPIPAFVPDLNELIPYSLPVAVKHQIRSVEQRIRERQDNLSLTRVKKLLTRMRPRGENQSSSSGTSCSESSSLGSLSGDDDDHSIQQPRRNSKTSSEDSSSP